MTAATTEYVVMPVAMAPDPATNAGPIASEEQSIVGARLGTAERVWTVDVDVPTYNLMPAIAFEGSGNPVVLIQLTNGELKCIELHTGTLLWTLPVDDAESEMAGGCAVRESATEREAIAYCTSNSNSPNYNLTNPGNYSEYSESAVPPGGTGLVRAVNMTDGSVLWSTQLDYATSSAPAYDDSLLYSACGIKVMCGTPGQGRGARDELDDGTASTCGWTGVVPGYMFALNLTTGELVWRLDAPDLDHYTPPPGSPSCVVDAFSSPAVDANSTVYYGWQGGKLYAVDGHSGTVLSDYLVDAGTQGEPAIGPDGAVYFATCTQLLRF